MNVTMDWANKIIHVPKSELTLTQASPTEIREMNLNDFRYALKAQEESEDGMPFLDTHRHNTEVLLGGITYARTLEIINGYTVTFEDGQYAVNLVGANSNVADVVNVNQVSVRSNNAAGLITSADIEHISFDGAVNLDTTNITGRARSGSVPPVGTTRAPVDNIADALVINGYRGFDKIRVWGPLDVDNNIAWDVQMISFVGEHPRLANVHIDDQALTSGCVFTDLTIDGYLDNDNQLDSCRVIDLQHINGELKNCALLGTLTLGGTTGATLNACYSGTETANFVATIDMGGSGRNLCVHNFSGHLKLTNMTGPDCAAIAMNHGRVIIDSTVTNGFIHISGNCRVEDYSTGSAVVSTAYVLGTTEIAAAVLDEAVASHLTAGSLGEVINLVRQISTNKLNIEQDGLQTKLVLYDDAGNTPVRTWLLTDDDGNPITLNEQVPLRRTPI